MNHNTLDLIRKKRDGGKLTKQEIEFLVLAYTNNKIPDYQFAAFLMAIYFQGMDFKETTNLTKAMLYSGEVLDLSHIKKPKIDKHSTGGVGDKVSLILAPLVAACGVCVPMISGRSLGHTGGTLDKLESIPGFRTNLTIKEFKNQLKEIGVAMIGQTEEIAPADRKIYALRDVTATVDSIPLISASIMSKKLAEDLDGLVLDVKFGSGAFMQDYKKAKDLARTMVQIGKRIKSPTIFLNPLIPPLEKGGKGGFYKRGNKGDSKTGFRKFKVIAVLTDMNNPLGTYVGNSLEVIETIEALKGNGPADLLGVTFTLGEAMLKLAKIRGGRKLLEEKIKNGEALNKFKEMIYHQGGNTGVIDDYSRLPVAKNSIKIITEKPGYVHYIDNLNLGFLATKLGVGRLKKEDKIDPGCGFRIFKKIGDFVKTRECLIQVFSDDKTKVKIVCEELKDIFIIKNRPCRRKTLIREIVNY